MFAYKTIEINRPLRTLELFQWNSVQLGEICGGWTAQIRWFVDRGESWVLQSRTWIWLDQYRNNRDDATFNNFNQKPHFPYLSTSRESWSNLYLYQRSPRWFSLTNSFKLNLSSSRVVVDWSVDQRDAYEWTWTNVWTWLLGMQLRQWLILFWSTFESASVFCWWPDKIVLTLDPARFDLCAK